MFRMNNIKKKPFSPWKLILNKIDRFLLRYIDEICCLLAYNLNYRAAIKWGGSINNFRKLLRNQLKLSLKSDIYRATH